VKVQRIILSIPRLSCNSSRVESYLVVSWDRFAVIIS